MSALPTLGVHSAWACQAARSSVQDSGPHSSELAVRLANENVIPCRTRSCSLWLMMRLTAKCFMTFYDDLWRLMTIYVNGRKRRKLSWRVANSCKMSWRLSWRLSQIVVTLFVPSPSRRPFLVFAVWNVAPQTVAWKCPEQKKERQKDKSYHSHGATHSTSPTSPPQYHQSPPPPCAREVAWSASSCLPFVTKLSLIWFQPPKKLPSDWKLLHN